MEILTFLFNLRVMYHYTLTRIYKNYRQDYRRSTGTWWDYTNSIIKHERKMIQLIDNNPQYGVTYEHNKKH